MKHSEFPLSCHAFSQRDTSKKRQPITNKAVLTKCAYGSMCGFGRPPDPYAAAQSRPELNERAPASGLALCSRRSCSSVCWLFGPSSIIRMAFAPSSSVGAMPPTMIMLFAPSSCIGPAFPVTMLFTPSSSVAAASPVIIMLSMPSSSICSSRGGATAGNAPSAFRTSKPRGLSAGLLADSSASDPPSSGAVWNLGPPKRFRRMYRPRWP
mmetsp:Transcript_59546/g.132593  ORF Transcript_59546/g.132593 Transcript_59546/m.132593 type:complete len:210 (-) Transcript_59546:162-791(-)